MISCYFHIFFASFKKPVAEYTHKLNASADENDCLKNVYSNDTDCIVYCILSARGPIIVLFCLQAINKN